MKKQLNCTHFKNEAKKTSVYMYKLIGAELNLCNKCEKKLRKQIMEQDSIEKEMDVQMKEWDKNEKLFKKNKSNTGGKINGKKKTQFMEQGS